MNQLPRQLYEFGPFRLDATERLLLRKGATVALTPKAFDLLFVLVERRGRLLEKDELLKLVWPDTFVEEANLSYNISLIRKALGDGENGNKFIETVPKRGYRFAAEVREVKDETVFAIQPAVQSDAGTNGFHSPTSVVTPAITSESREETSQVAVKSPLRKILVAVVAFVVFAGVTAGLYWFAKPSPARLAESKVIPFTTFQGEEDDPTFSPDGNRIAFTWRGPNDDNADLYVKQPGSEGVQRLTTDPAEDYCPEWSPDGRQLAFLRYTSTGSGSVWLVSALGGGERKLTEVFNRVGQGKNLSQAPRLRLHWSPDGRSLAIVDKARLPAPYSIFSLDVETGERRPLTAPPATAVGDRSPAFSPDGKLLAFVRVSGAPVADVYVIPATGGEPRRLTFGNQGIGRLAWTSDSQEIVFDQGILAENRELWRVAVNGGNSARPERIIAAGQSALEPAIASAGNRLVWVQALNDVNIWRLDLSGINNSGNGAAKPFISSTQIEVWPEYSPDGKRVLFISLRSGMPEIWVCGAEGENPVQVTNLNQHTGTPHWSADSRSIVFDTRVDGNADIYVVSADGGKPRRMTTDPAEEFAGSWSRDGNWIWFCSARSGSLQMWKMPAQGGEATQMTKHGGFEGFESPDGKYFYYAKGRDISGIWRIPVTGGEETPVLDQHQSGLLRAWKVVNEGIYFAAASADTPPRFQIEFFDFASGKIRHVAAIEKSFQKGMSISPDGRWLLYAQQDRTGRDIMLMENFR